MTIFFNERWNGYPQLSIASLDQHDEKVLIAQGIAREVDCYYGESKTTAAAFEFSTQNSGNMPRVYIRLVTFEAGESLKIGFGASEAAAKTAAASGVVLNGFEEITLDIPVGQTWLGFVSVGGNVDFYYAFCEA